MSIILSCYSVAYNSLSQLSEQDFRQRQVNIEASSEAATEVAIEPLPSRFYIFDVTERIARRKKITPMFARN